MSLEAIDHVHRLYRNGCSTSEDLFWKLDALQSFIHDLHWPDAEFARHLEQRLKLMACDMIESCIQRSVVPLKLSLPPADMLDLLFLWLERTTRSSSGWRRASLLRRPITFFRPSCAPWSMSSWTPNNNRSNYALWTASMWWEACRVTCHQCSTLKPSTFVPFSLAAPVPHENRWTHREDVIEHVSR